MAIAPGELLSAGADRAWIGRLAAYWSARDRYIQVGRDVRATTDPQAMLSQVRDPLLSVLRLSPDFRPAYDPLLRMAVALGRRDPEHARVLLAELRRIQPLRPEAEEGLRALDGARLRSPPFERVGAAATPRGSSGWLDEAEPPLPPLQTRRSVAERAV